MTRGDDLRKKYGKDAVFTAGGGGVLDVEFVSTGNAQLDEILSGGFPKGRIVELYGNEGSGKTTVALHLIAQAQADGLNCLFIDVEHSFDPTYAETIGIDLKKLDISQPQSGEQALNIMNDASSSGEYGVVVLDSVAALVPEAELAGDVGDSHVGKMARLMGQTLRKMTHGTSEAKTVAVFINQVREKIGVMFGNPETTPGGRALKFFASVRLEVRRTSTIKENDQYAGHKVKIKSVKNKVAPPFRTTELEIMYGKGFATVTEEVLQRLVDEGRLGKNGSWYVDVETGEKVGQGKANAKAWLEEHPEFLKGQ